MRKLSVGELTRVGDRYEITYGDGAILGGVSFEYRDGIAYVGPQRVNVGGVTPQDGAAIRRVDIYREELKEPLKFGAIIELDKVRRAIRVDSDERGKYSWRLYNGEMRSWKWISARYAVTAVLFGGIE